MRVRFTGHKEIMLIILNTNCKVNFAFLAKDMANPRDFAGDIALAILTGQNLVDNPYFEGFSRSQIGGIANFGEPIPNPPPFFF